MSKFTDSGLSSEFSELQNSSLFAQMSIDELNDYVLKFAYFCFFAVAGSCTRINASYGFIQIDGFMAHHISNYAHIVI